MTIAQIPPPTEFPVVHQNGHDPLETEVAALERRAALLRRKAKLEVEISKLCCDEWRGVVRLGAIAFGIPIGLLIGKTRTQDVSDARQACMYVIRQKFKGASLPCIGRFLGGRDHSTITHGVRAAAARIDTDKNYARKVKIMMEAVL